MPDPTDPEQLLAQAAAALATGDPQEANRLMDLAEAASRLQRLTAGDKKVMVPDVERTEEARRSHSLAKYRAKRNKHPLPSLLVLSKWKTITTYAEERLNRSQAALSRYMSGTLPTPPEVADQVFADFGLKDDCWPKPPERPPGFKQVRAKK